MIHVLTLTWNGIDKLKTLRPKLLENLDKTVIPYQWHIRDNGSTDDTLQLISSWGEVSVLAVDHNRDNFAQGMNSLAKRINFNDGDMILLLNNDVEFIDDDSLSTMVSLLKNDVAVVGAKLLYKGTNKLQHAGVIFSEKYGSMPYHFRHQEDDDESSSKNRYFQAVTAAVCLVDAKTFMSVGGFDEKFNWAFEDIALCLAIGSLGKKIAYCGQTNIFHEESASLKRNPVNKMFLHNNVKHFKNTQTSKYHLDHKIYLNNKNYLTF